MLKIFLTLTMMLPVLACAQDRLSLTAEDAVSLGLTNNRGLHISSWRWTAAEARSAETGTARLPSLKLQAGYTRLSDIEPFAVSLSFLPAPVLISPTVLNTYSSKVTLFQPLFTGFRLEKAAESADYAAQAAGSDYAKDRVDLAFSIRSAYWNLSRARETQRVITENVDQMNAHLTDVRNLMGQGLATMNDVLKVQVQLSSVELTQIDAANAERVAAMSLNLLLGLPLDAEVDTAPVSPEDTAGVRALAQVDSLALAERADIRASDLRMKAADASVVAARGAWYPQVSLVGDYYYSRPNPRILPTKDEFRGTWDAGIMLSFDLWNWGATARQTEQAEAALSQAREAFEQTRESALMDARQSALALYQARDKIGVARQGVEQAEENYRTTKNKFEGGAATNTDLLDAEVALLQAKLSASVARVDFEIARARMLRSLGKEK